MDDHGRVVEVQRHDLEFDPPTPHGASAGGGEGRQAEHAVSGEDVEARGAGAGRGGRGGSGKR